MRARTHFSCWLSAVLAVEMRWVNCFLRIAALTAVALLVLACAEQQARQPIRSHAPAASQPQQYEPPSKQVEILSEPPGARIEINGDYIGDAPITATIPCDNGQFTRTTIIRALPTQPGHFVQTKFFTGSGYRMLRNDQVPSRIFFDMRLGPVSPDINVNVNQQ